MKFDEPVGHNNGSVKGIKIFECPEGYGAFVRGTHIQVGEQFTERDLLDESCDNSDCHHDDDDDAAAAAACEDGDEDEI